MHDSDVSEELISRLSYIPTDLLHAVITISDPPQPMEADSQYRPSSLGALDRLPLELLHEVLGHLDFWSLALFSRVSVQGKHALLSSPWYRDLMSHAPHALAALAQTKIIRRHSVSELVAALRTQRCATCPEYGAYLFLPACERCCWQCMVAKPTRQVIPANIAGTDFAIPPEAVRQMPFMLTVPGKYGLKAGPDWGRLKFVSVIDVKECAIAVHGSVENLTRAGTHHRTGQWAAFMYWYMASVFSNDTLSDTLMKPEGLNQRLASYLGMASVPFPSITAGGAVEQGLWCKGCESMRSRFGTSKLPAQVLADLVPEGCQALVVISGLAKRARSRAGFLEHIQHCYGAQELLADEVKGRLNG